MFLTPVVLGLSALLTGCTVYTDSDVGPHNASPWFNFAESGCFWDGHYGDDIWYFYADADDPNGPMDVVEVYADVYDSWDGAWIDGFELVPLNAYEWYSEFPAHNTWLDCFYRGYDVVFTAVDSFGASATLSVMPYTY